MSKDYMNPFGDLSGIKAEPRVIRSTDVDAPNYNINTNRGDLARQIDEYKNEYLRANGYDPEEYNNVNSEELDVLEQLKAQYGSLEDIKKNLLNAAPVEDTNKLQLSYVKAPAVKQQTAADKLIDELLAEI